MLFSQWISGVLPGGDTQIKNKISGDGDSLRETKISQFYRYAKISQLLRAGQFCRYVEDTCKFVHLNSLQIHFIKTAKN